MTAYPVRTDVARQFLATDARAGWDPLQKVITYEGRGSTTGSSEVKVDLLGAHWIDSRGNWRGQRGSGDIRLRFPIVQEGDAFRIASCAERADRPRRLVPGPLRAGVHLLPRPDRADPGARARVRADRPGRRGPGAAPARRAEPGAEGRGPVVRAAGPDPGAVRAGQRGRGRDDDPGGRSGAAHAGGREADGLPVRLDPAAGRARHHLQHHHRRPAGDHGGRHVAVQRRARLGVRAVRRAGELVAVPAARTACSSPGTRSPAPPSTVRSARRSTASSRCRSASRPAWRRRSRAAARRSRSARSTTRRTR